ncbi:tetratricopeptide repeat protein [Winogradskyella psychrotolerans]|uniref:tetratricopeptide repeat protein n=1 Tax=Winogradskyella psychrotolerans TaxID=1344585 RepID=UPI001C0720FC|nr:hypothetical protein [Winogradskyella psychrotolerans]MBU2929395.1 hypothetical protein [Winogradskyella psychrotolerans]
MKRSILYVVAMFGFCTISAQSYKSGYRTDVCACLEDQSLKRSLTVNTLNGCLRKILPKYADLIDAQIDEPDVQKKYYKGQVARKDLMVAMSHELVYTCDVYFQHIDDRRTSKKLIAREKAKASELERYNQMVALQPKAISYYMRAQLQFNLGHIKEAEADLNKSLEVNPYKESVKHTRYERLLLAWVYEEQEKYSAAVAVYDKIYMGDLDSEVAILRALANRKAGGTLTSNPLVKQVESVSNTSTTTQRETTKTDQSTTVIEKKASTNTAKNSTLKTEKKKDTASLRKLLKIGG